MKVLLLAPSVIDMQASHDTNALLTHTSLLQKAGIDVAWGTHKKTKASLSEGTHYRCFDYTIYDDYISGTMGRWSRFKRRNIYRQLAANASSELKQLIGKEKLTAQDHVFIPTSDWIMLQAIFNYIDSVDESYWPHLHFQLMFIEASWMTGGYPFKEMLSCLKSMQKKMHKVFLYSETKASSRVIKALTGMPVFVYPYPILESDFGKGLCAKKEGCTRELITISVLGGGRRDKGFDRLPDIIQRFNVAYKQPSNVEFVIQKAREVDCLDNDISELQAQENVSFLPASISHEEYRTALVNSSVLLMPYSRAYEYRGSGVVMEALANGIPILCSKNTGLCDALTHENGLSVTTNEEFGVALMDIVANLEIYRTAACKAKEAYAEALLMHNPLVSNIRVLK